MKVLLVSNGFPPSGQWGTEFYTHQLATGLSARGHTVDVLHPTREPGRPRYQLDSRERFGVHVHELANAGDPKKRFADSYENREVEHVFGGLVEALEPDVVHFTHLLWGLSVNMPRIASELGAGTLATLTDFGLVCHRGQLFDWRLEQCAGPADDACARCVREPARYDGRPERVFAQRACVRTLALLGERGPLVSASDIERRRGVIRTAFESVDRWIAPTRALLETFVEHGLPRERSSHLVYGIDESRFRAGRHPSAAADEANPLRIGFMGQFLPHKGLGVLLEAVRLLEARLPESIEPWTVEVYGNVRAGRHGRYLDSILAPGVSERVRIHGPFAPLEAPRILDEISVLVVPSLWGENAPLSVLQARAAGVPVIASDVAGIREVLEPGVHGLSFPAGDAAALCDALREFVDGRFARRVPSDPVVTHRAHLREIESLYASTSTERKQLPERVAVVAALP